jgi:hypothetical protein
MLPGYLNGCDIFFHQNDVWGSGTANNGIGDFESHI